MTNGNTFVFCQQVSECQEPETATSPVVPWKQVSNISIESILSFSAAESLANGVSPATAQTTLIIFTHGT